MPRRLGARWIGTLPAASAKAYPNPEGLLRSGLTVKIGNGSISQSNVAAVMASGTG